ncbi:MAG: hypothetical protein GY820_30470, partial [Gammaproteobacteria bacterium]|nr:hypothetical protein [Gammaproteobacteria bacterium]
MTFTVTDPGGLTDSAAVTITAADTNRAPVLDTADPVSTAEGTPVTFQVPAQDPDGDPLTFTLAGAPGGMTIEQETGLISWTPETGQHGTHSVTVDVSDPGGASDTEVYTFIVEKAPDRIPPVLNITAPSRVRVSEAVNIAA